MRTCPVSGSEAWEPAYSSLGGRIMTGDQRIVGGRLAKLICPASGVVANERAFSPDELELLYGREYELNTLGREEHFFYTPQGVVARSQVFFEWLVPHLPENFDSLLEFGCGEGNLLARIAARYPERYCAGFDGSHKAVQLARAKRLKVEQCIIDGERPIPTADVFLLVNVIEHIEDIPLLLACLRNSLSEHGRLIFCLPIQDYGGYDVFFAEHVWHFTAEHFACILRRNGLKIVHSDTAHAINHGIGLFVCEKSAGETPPVVTTYSDVVRQNVAVWQDRFRRLDDYVAAHRFGRVAIFGAGEVATLFLTFTSLARCNIVACIDDTKGPGEEKHGIPIYGSEWLTEHQVDCLFLTVNQKYHASIRAKLRDVAVRIHAIY